MAVDSPAEESIRHELQNLDSLDLPFIYFDPGLKADFISARAASCLSIRHRTQLELYSRILAPLQGFARQCLGAALSRPFNAGLNQGREFSELALATAEGRQLSAFAYSSPLRISKCFSEQETEEGIVVVFYELTYLEPFLRTIEQSRKNRAIIVLASSIVGKPLALELDSTNLIKQYQAAEEKLGGQSSFHPALSSDQSSRTDFLNALGTAVDIVDPLLAPNAKIIIQARTAALLSISTANFLRLTSHFLLEASDFVGPFGDTKVNAAIKEKKIQTQEGVTAAYHILELEISARRQSSLPLNAPGWELFFYRRYMPLYYKVTLAKTSLPDAGMQSREVLLGADSEQSGLTFSDNLRIASHIARLCQVTFSLARPEPDMLKLTAQFQLA